MALVVVPPGLIAGIGVVGCLRLEGGTIGGDALTGIYVIWYIPRMDIGVYV
jgi:hypothetical protein